MLQEIDSLPLRLVRQPVQMVGPGILLFDQTLLKRWGPIAQWRHRHEDLLIIAEDGQESADFFVPRGWPETFTLKALEGAIKWMDTQLRKQALSAELVSEHKKLFQLTQIGLALSAETNLNRLLTKILAEGRNWGCCDAASLFLIDKQTKGEPELVFMLSQNDSVSCPFEEQRFPLNTQSIAGFVAVTGKVLSIPDVYLIPREKPYHFNNSFDESIQYRTRSMIAIPMKNHNQEVIGVLQFINRKTAPDIRLTSREITEKHTLPFSGEIAELLKALASQAAVAIGNTLLVSRIQQLFEGFVQAAVTAIEQRDPTTSGHSFRVAELTTELAKAAPRSDLSRFRSLSFNDKQLREIRYASLLHDFGKVGVREPVLVKAKKLPDRVLDLIWHRFTLFKEQLRRKGLESRLNYILKHGREAYMENMMAFDRELERELVRFTRFYREIARANEPTILPEGTFSHLEQIRDFEPFHAEDRNVKLLTDSEFMALSVRKGSLTEAERKEIELHVVHTYNFLKQIPWTEELGNIPAYAVAHHEKLDGSGYPFGMAAAQIPLPSKMMTVSDIYDALTASDRPYKKALPPLRALEILELEAGQGLLDLDLVQVFIEAKVYEKKPPKQVEALPYETYVADFFKRNVCDYEWDPEATLET